MTSPNYPLARVLEIKKKRVEEAEKFVKEKERELQLERDKLAERRRERDVVKQHKFDKIQQLREEMDRSTTSPKIQQMKIYIEVVEEKLVAEQKKVDDQKEQVKVAEQNLEMAKETLREKRREVDKINEHKALWTKQVKQEEEREIAKTMDEIGQIVHQRHRRQK